MTPRHCFYLLLATLLPPFPLGAEGALPEAAQLDRYERLRNQSPFALATAPAPVVAPPVETPAFSNEYYVVGIANMGEAQFVTISTKDRQKRFSLMVGEKTSDGVTLASVEWQPAVGQSRVTLQKGEESGVITFDQAAMIAVAPPQAAAPQPQRPGQQPAYLNQGRPANAGQNDQDERRRRWRERRQNWERRGQGGGAGPSGGGGNRDERFQQWRQRQQSIGTGR